MGEACCCIPTLHERDPIQGLGRPGPKGDPNGEGACFWVLTCGMDLRGLGHRRLLLGIGSWLKSHDGISLGLLAGFVLHQIHLHGSVDGGRSAQFVMALLAFAEASGFAFHVVVGPGEILIRKKATGFQKRVSREALEGLL